jgi:hypothetical protein
MPRYDAGSGASRRRNGARTSRAGDTKLRNTSDFVLYVEGPRDRDILCTWSRRLAPRLSSRIEKSIVILGGRQPARAVEHFQAQGGRDAGLSGLVVLDRDHHEETEDRLVAEVGLELFTWGRRHIESYVLVPSAVRRLVAGSQDAQHLDRLLEAHVPAHDDESAFRQINAKHLLGSKGPLAQELGRTLTPGALARSMRVDEFHRDVVNLYDRIRSGLGVRSGEPEVIRRPVAP